MISYKINQVNNYSSLTQLLKSNSRMVDFCEVSSYHINKGMCSKTEHILLIFG
nr:MAG TPA: hypothetical protein [Caudoviricetes sp.]